MRMSGDNRRDPSWKASDTRPAVQLYLNVAEGDAGALAGAEAAGLPLQLVITRPGDEIDLAEVDRAAAAIIQVAEDEDGAAERFGAMARATETPLIAAAFDPSLSFVRALIRGGAHDVIPLPLDVAELETSLQPIRDEMQARDRRQSTGPAKLITMIKSEGGVGATALMGQLASRFAALENRAGREALLLDLDIQFGDAAFQLGLHPKLGVDDLLAAGTRMDGDMMRTVAAPHPSGLNVIAAPAEITRLDALDVDQALALVEAAMKEYGTVFVDLPTNWTDWSLSLLARSDLVIMVCELSIASLHRAKRQLDLITAQDLGHLDVRIAVNRFEKGLFKNVTREDAERVLGRPVAYTLANDHATMTAAIEQGIPVAEIRRKGALNKDLKILEGDVAARLGLER
ncbi:AAA family ATPase [Sphingomicrobium arenosum]|uniref:AAA family ATPase n=1 Tax=Sphingomicrobium arenosum TaxID=2233861 RepID=UPI002240F6A5|nr:AAA family ATPase [Sphingomicrobium arenosum]